MIVAQPARMVDVVQGTPSSLFNVVQVHCDEPLDYGEQLGESPLQQFHSSIPPSDIPSGLSLGWVCVALPASACRREGLSDGGRHQAGLSPAPSSIARQTRWRPGGEPTSGDVDRHSARRTRGRESGERQAAGGPRRSRALAAARPLPSIPVRKWRVVGNSIYMIFAREKGFALRQTHNAPHGCGARCVAHGCAHVYRPPMRLPCVGSVARTYRRLDRRA